MIMALSRFSSATLSTLLYKIRAASKRCYFLSFTHFSLGAVFAASSPISASSLNFFQGSQVKAASLLPKMNRTRSGPRGYRRGSFRCVDHPGFGRRDSRSLCQTRTALAFEAKKKLQGLARETFRCPTNRFHSTDKSIHPSDVLKSKQHMKRGREAQTEDVDIDKSQAKEGTKRNRAAEMGSKGLRMSRRHVLS